MYLALRDGLVLSLLSSLSVNFKTSLQLRSVKNCAQNNSKHSRSRPSNSKDYNQHFHQYVVVIISLHNVPLKQSPNSYILFLTHHSAILVVGLCDCFFENTFKVIVVILQQFNGEHIENLVCHVFLNDYKGKNTTKWIVFIIL